MPSGPFSFAIAWARVRRPALAELKAPYPARPPAWRLRGDVRCRALLRGLKSAVAKTLLSMPDLRYRALAEIRKQPGCSNVQGIAINRVSDQHAENNWSLCVSSAGTADANTAARAALHVQSVLRRDYDLMAD